MAKRRSVAQAGKLLIAAMKQTADENDREVFEPVGREAPRDRSTARSARILSVAEIFAAISSSESFSR
jgi:hypothetical protein